MARKSKIEKQMEVVEKLTTSFIVTQKLRGSINGKSYSFEVGEKIELTPFEASVFKNFIKEE